jgi:hypothetical protein
MLHSSLPTEFLLKPLTDKARGKLELLPREERKSLVLLNPALFGEYYIKPYTRKWNTNTALHQYYMLEKMMEHNDIVIHVPVEHAKSTWFSLVVPLWLMCRDRNTQGCIISNTARQAEGFLRAIKWHIEFNPRFKEDFGDYVIPNKPSKKDPSGKWTDNSIFILRDSSQQSKDPTILAIGTGGALLGARLDWVVADDIIDLGNSQTELQRKKVEDWWFEIVDSRVVEGGRRIVLGTLQHNQDLLCMLSDNDDYNYVHLSSLDENNVPLWPEQWDYDRIIAKKKSAGTIRWLKTMQNDRSALSVKMLDPSWLNYYDALPPRLSFYIGVDPAIADDKKTGEKLKQDKFGLVVVGFDRKTTNMYLVEEYAEWLTFPQQLRLIEQYNQKYKPIRIGIESVAYQRALAQQSFILKDLPPVLAVKVGTQSKATRIESFSVHVENGRFLIHRKHVLFEDEWREYEPGGKSPNILDASVIAVMTIKNAGNLKDVKMVDNNIKQVNW